MRKLDLLLEEYASSHKNHTNKSIHWIMVPLIFWSIMGFISIIPTPHICLIYYGCVSLASILCIALVSIYYFKLSRIMGVIMFFIMLIFQYIVYQVNIYFKDWSWAVFLVVFVVSWIFQFIGHKIEGKKPSFLKDLQFLLIGPIWLLHFVMKKWGLKY